MFLYKYNLDQNVDTSKLKGLYFNRMILKIILIKYVAMTKLWLVEPIHLM